MTRVVVATGEPVGEVMAGPAIRAVETARVLRADGHHVDVVAGERDGRRLAELVAAADVLVAQGDVLTDHPQVGDGDVAVVVDAYDPFHLEQLEQTRGLDDAARRRVTHDTVTALADQLTRADLVLCASERQRHLWLGHLAALGRVNPRTYDDDPTLRGLLVVVPFGVGEPPPVAGPPVARGVLPGVGPDDRLLLWNGGVYNWLDPLTAIRAVHLLAADRPDLRLVFLGTGHPNPAVPTMRMAAEARRLADELGVTSRHVFFNPGWVPYDERGRWLLEADLVVSTHLDTVETAYSSRTRLVDAVWAGVPMVVSQGDEWGERVEREGLGIAVPPGDAGLLADALGTVLDAPARARRFRRNAELVRAELAWPRVLEPLRAFVATPRRAPDLLDPAVVKDLPGRRLARPRTLAQRVARRLW